jgi:hypothetical protein
MSDLLQIPDLPQDIPANLREWCEAIQQILVVRTDALQKRNGQNFATVDEMITAGIVNADELKE